MVSPSARRSFLELAGGSALALAYARGANARETLRFPAPIAQKEGDEIFEPRRGQGGKDVIWIPTPNPLVARMLQLAQLKPSERLVDLGSGDGKIVIAAARDFGARAHGIEYNEDMVALSQRNAAAAGVADRATFVQGDIFRSDFSSADVVTMYLMPNLNLRLRHTLMAMKPGTRVVSHEFRMGDWEPDETSKIGAASMHLWIVPANAGGDWALRIPMARGQADATMVIEQKFQKPRGVVSVSGVDTTLRNGLVSGERIRFSFTDRDGALRDVDARIEPGRMTGTISSPRGQPAAFAARRVGDTPAIQGSAPVAPEEIQNW